MRKASVENQWTINQKFAVALLVNKRAVRWEEEEDEDVACWQLNCIWRVLRTLNTINKFDCNQNWNCLHILKSRPFSYLTKHHFSFDFCLTVHHQLTLILLTWRIRWARNNASKWQMGFNMAFKGLSKVIQVNQLDATTIYWSIRSAQHVSGNILPIIRSVRLRYLQHMVSCCCGG